MNIQFDENTISLQEIQGAVEKAEYKAVSNTEKKTLLFQVWHVHPVLKRLKKQQ